MYFQMFFNVYYNLLSFNVVLQDHSRHRRRHSSSFAVDHVVFTSISLSHQFSDDLIEVLSQLLHVLCGLKVDNDVF